MAAGACRDRDQAVGALLDRLVREAIVDDVVQRHAAVGVHRCVDVLARAERRDDDRRLPLDRHRHVFLKPGVRLVDDLVDRKRRGGAFGMRAVMGGERFGDLMQPFVELRNRSGVQRGKGADDPGLALGDHQRRMRDDEQRSADDRQPELVFQNVGQRHRGPLAAGQSRCDPHSSFTHKPTLTRRASACAARSVRLRQPGAKMLSAPPRAKVCASHGSSVRASSISVCGGLTTSSPARASGCWPCAPTGP